ncbi:3-hydroxyacyl-CoA dehydrogenase family protein [Chitinophaga alhagiae]|nr:3-hydroxyacyl-CoA dehydrogenase family protein [Chitinophaga alhagiae]
MEVGVVGLGLMGSSIVVALLLSGQKVIGVAPVASDLAHAEKNMRAILVDCAKASPLQYPVEWYMQRLTLTEAYAALANCRLVMECVLEKAAIKASVYDKIEAVVSRHTVIASNTSAIPISDLQRTVLFPDRFVGVHWAEPAFATRFLEITCGKQTDPAYAEWVVGLSAQWEKEPTVLKKDIRGFITNRLMYAVYRELFHLVETGKTTIEDADKAFRYDAGAWITLMGIFRRMDYTGLEDGGVMLRNIIPTLSNTGRVPVAMQQILEKGGRGTQNQVGLYSYSVAEARLWEESFAKFNREIYQLAARYPLRKQQVDV